MLRGACRRGTHTFKQMTVNKKNPPRTPTTEEKTQNTRQRGKKTRNKQAHRHNRTDDDRRTALAKAEAGTENGSKEKDEKNKQESLNRPPGPLQTTQGQDQRKDLDPGVRIQGARGSNIQTEKETPQPNP